MAAIPHRRGPDLTSASPPALLAALVTWQGRLSVEETRMLLDAMFGKNKSLFREAMDTARAHASANDSEFTIEQLTDLLDQIVETPERI